MKFLVLSHFDQKIGPRIFIAVGNKLQRNYLDEIPRYMDYHENGYFIHEHRSIKSANMIFNIDSSIARGESEIIMISVVLIEDNTDPRIYYQVLEQFVEQLKNIRGAYKGFHIDNNNLEGVQENYDKIEALMHSTYKTFPLEPYSLSKMKLIF
ncbi:MAG: hypothetical protein ACFFAH_17590 [Promethearchaeota archaeon]